ncbi:hypothetical protein GCM10009087_07330 [Sphingomonas oligophenolica]|uniref:Uncharacterized protein n=1 Tax=Sphingomonas oligophenolica TaxID=301154 RepID=A0ABU9XXI3_9SPHN
MTMFGQKPLASLSSTLLARKGTARPAMRPQGFGGFGTMPGQHDDLGWNDMGGPDLRPPDDFQPEQAYAQPEPVYAPPAQPALVPPVLRQREALQEEFSAPMAYEDEAEAEEESEGTSSGYASLERPIPLRTFPENAFPEQAPDDEPHYAPEQRHVPEPYRAPEPELQPRPISVATARRIARETHAKPGKAAFTLRLDQGRHLRLRLASALHNVSAQVLVTEALDQFLQSLPEVQELASQLPSRAER